jgi:hypothetical protein
MLYHLRKVLGQSNRIISVCGIVGVSVLFCSLEEQLQRWNHSGQRWEICKAPASLKTATKGQETIT